MNLIKKILFGLVIVEIVVIYYAIINEFSGLLLSYCDDKLTHIGYLFSVEGPIKFFIKFFIPATLSFRFFTLKSQKREDLINYFGEFYSKVTTAQLIICLFLFSTIWFYIHKFYFYFFKKINNEANI